MPKKSVLHQRLMLVLENSVGCGLFRGFLIKEKGEIVDCTEEGFLSCAFFVSAILRILTKRDEVPLIDAVSLSNVTLLDEGEGNHQLLDCGWQEIDYTDFRKLEPGTLVFWEEQDEARHCGFIIQQDEAEPLALSNSSVNGMPIKHHPTFNGQRMIIHAFWHPAFDQ